MSCTITQEQIRSGPKKKPIFITRPEIGKALTTKHFEEIIIQSMMKNEGVRRFIFENFGGKQDNEINGGFEGIDPI